MCEGHENKYKRENTIFFCRSWLIQILRGVLTEEFLPEYFILGVLLNGSDPCFESKLRGTN